MKTNRRYYALVCVHTGQFRGIDGMDYNLNDLKSGELLLFKLKKDGINRIKKNCCWALKCVPIICCKNVWFGQPTSYFIA